ncbi:RNA polymerase sigma factor [Aciditerrimonas ferrireducens]|uniref:RNA polymerase sigma factor n=1 Tax=Aciditerrimonas ferrireducens TaxID=667306 RepID=UPI00200544A9|nr:RNA polymerase sigma factor [Aciditerrimonas ferrireducens]MCK4176096.1 RNA polymerase sigma factor [Aciditerrimonas ferrireducens]
MVRAARAGDAGAVGALIAATYGEVLGVAQRILQDPHDAADAAQETYVRAIRGLRRFRGDAQVSTWLYRIAVRCALDLRRAQARRREIGLDQLTADQLAAEHGALRSAAPDPAVAPERAEQRAELAAALQGLPDRLRLTVLLRDVEGFSTAETAQFLGISETAAKVRLHRGRRLLRERLFGAQDPRPAARDARRPRSSERQAPGGPRAVAG